MPTALFLTPIGGSGTEGDPYQATLSSDVSAHVAVIPSDPVTGKPKFAWALVRATAPAFTAMNAIPGVQQLPDVPLSASFGSLPVVMQNAILAALESKGVGTSQITASVTMGQIVRAIVRHLDAGLRDLSPIGA